MPKYSPPKPVEKKLEDEEAADLRELDRPQNGIIRLPKVIVEGSTPPIFKSRDRDREMMTSQAYARMLSQRMYSEGYLAFNRFAQYTPLRLFLPSAESSAMAQYYEEQRLVNMGELKDAANDAARAGNKAESDYIKRASNETYMSRSDFGWKNTNK